MLTDYQILEAMNMGDIVIEPFERKQLGPNGYDVRLHHKYWRFKSELYRRNQQGIPLLFELNNGFDASILYDLHDANDTNGRIMVRPGECILATTQEIIGSRPGKLGYNFVPYFKTRSTIARLFLPFEFTGMGDVGYVSRWTLELHNLSPVTFLIPVGARIGQMVFFMGGEVEKPYEGKHYNAEEDWSPLNMLPNVRL